MRNNQVNIKPKYKAVIFDFDDTLVESRIAKWAHHKHVAKKFYNIDLSDEDIRKHWGKPINVLITELYKSSDTLENMYEAILSVRQDFPKYPYKESISTIHELLNHNIKIGVVSATSTKFLLQDLPDLGFPIDNFSIIQGADKTEKHKPDPGVFTPLLEHMEREGIYKDDIVYVGDSLDDLKASINAGINFIGLTTGLYSREDFKKNGGKIIFNKIDEILKEIL